MHPGRFGLRWHLSTRRVGFGQYPGTRWVERGLHGTMGLVGRRLHVTARLCGFVRPPLPIRAIDAVVAWQYAIFVHSLRRGQATRGALALWRFWRRRFFLRRRRRPLFRRRRRPFLRRRRRPFLRRRRRSVLRRRRRSVLRSRRRSVLRSRRRLVFRRRHDFVFSPFAVVALPKGADDHRHDHQQDDKVAEIDADSRPRRLWRSTAHEIWMSVARHPRRSGN
jgi:hypothetical protein